jgi:hypothetical protein
MSAEKLLPSDELKMEADGCSDRVAYLSPRKMLSWPIAMSKRLRDAMRGRLWSPQRQYERRRSRPGSGQAQELRGAATAATPADANRMTLLAEILKK